MANTCQILLVLSPVLFIVISVKTNKDKKEEIEEFSPNISTSTFRIKFIKNIIERQAIDTEAIELALNLTQSEDLKHQSLLFCELIQSKDIYFYHGIIGSQYHYGISSLSSCLYHCAAHNYERDTYQRANDEENQECKAINYFAYHKACQLLSCGIENLETADRRAYGRLKGATHAFIQYCYGPDSELSSTLPSKTQRPPTTTPRVTSTTPPQKGLCGVSVYPPSVNYQSNKTRIIRGEEARPHSWPWVIVLILDFGLQRSFCGGTLLRINDEVDESDIVLTAAHCVTRSETQSFNPTILDPNTMYVVAGDHRRQVREAGEVHRRVTSIRFHSRFQFTPHTGAMNDVAILKLQTPIPFNDIIRPICLPEQNDPIPIGSLCVAAGWGRNDSRFMYVMPDALQELIIPIQDAQTCSNAWGQIYNERAMLCAGSLSGTASTCQGDSGGMLVCKSSDGRWVQQGIISFGVGGSCLEPLKPAVFTRVNSYVDWIRKSAAAMTTIKNSKSVITNSGFEYVETANVSSNESLSN